MPPKAVLKVGLVIESLDYRIKHFSAIKLFPLLLLAYYFVTFLLFALPFVKRELPHLPVFTS